MSKKDVYHDNVREALEKDGWTIVRDPLRIYISQTDYFKTTLK